MYQYKMNVPESVQALYWTTYKWPNRMMDDLEQAKRRLEYSRAAIVQRIEVEEGYVVDSIATLRAQIEYFESLNNISLFSHAKNRVLDLSELVRSTQLLVKSIKRQQGSMGITISNFEELDHITDRYQQFETLWLKLVDDARTVLGLWVNEWFMNLNADMMTSKVIAWNSLIRDCETYFEVGSNSRRVVSQIKDEVDDFWRNTNVIATLRNPALKSCHWDRLHSIIGLSLVDFQALRLNQIMELDLELVHAVISDISNQANSTYKLELSLEKMKNELCVREFKISRLHGLEVTFFSNGEDAIFLLEDQLLRCEQLFLAVRDLEIKLKFEKWISQLQNALELLRAILEMQQFYVKYLPFLNSLGSMGLLPKNVEVTFEGISKTCAIIANVFSKNRNLINLIYRGDLIELVSGIKPRISAIYDGIKPLLAAERAKFPRFYFAHDEQLLATLGCMDCGQLSELISSYFPSCVMLSIKDARSIGPPASLNKNRRPQITRSHAPSSATKNETELIVESSKLVTGIVGKDGETLLFTEPVGAISLITLQLTHIESQIHSTLRAHFKNAWEAREMLSQNPVEFVTNYPLQIGLLVANIYWGMEIAEVIESKSLGKATDYQGELECAIEALANENSSTIPVALKHKLESLIGVLMNFHAQLEEVVNSNYEGGRGSFVMHYVVQDDFNIEISLSKLPPISYGFDFLGIDCRLQVAPLMMKTFFRLMNLCAQRISPLLTGPSPGCGKTATIQAFSYLLGYEIMIYECRSIDVAQLSRVIQGHLSSNVWVVLKNIHQLSTAVNLKLEAMISNIQSTLQGLPRLKMPIISTMNGIQEWSGIPFNTRLSFKIVGVTRPDLAFIVQAILITNGFKNYKQLSKKIEICINTCGVIIPIKPGIAIIRKVLDIAIQIKTESAKAIEDSIIRQAFLYYFKNSLNSADNNVLKDITSSIFNQNGDERVPHPIPASTVIQALKLEKFVYPDYFIQKVVSMLKSLELKNNIIVYGDTYTGKTKLWKLTATVANTLLLPETPIKVMHTFPNALNNFLDDDTEDSRYFSSLLTEAKLYCREKEFILGDRTDLKKICSLAWLVIDGDAGRSGFTEKEALINSFQNENHCMVQLIYETKSLTDASPGLIGRSSLLYLDTKLFKSDMLVSGLLSTAPTRILDLNDYVMMIFSAIVVPAIRFMQSDYSWPKAIHVERIAVCRVFKLLLCLFYQKGDLGYERMTCEEQCAWILLALIFCTIWVVGADISHPKKIAFNSFFRNHLQTVSENDSNLEDAANLPSGYLKCFLDFPEGLVFDYFVDEKLLKWTLWKDHHEHNKVVKNNLRFAIPNEDFLRLNVFKLI